ncbi:MAG TPA: hypothetical protein VF137_11035 [Candidatus Dormibacteraeota bacterium]
MSLASLRRTFGRVTLLAVSLIVAALLGCGLALASSPASLASHPTGVPVTPPPLPSASP